MPTYHELSKQVADAYRKVEAARLKYLAEQRKYFALSAEADEAFEAENKDFLAKLPDLGKVIQHKIQQNHAYGPKLLQHTP